MKENETLKCPFCGMELVNTPWENDWYNCPNIKCEHVGQSMHKSIWQVLIDGKKAQDALKEIKTRLENSFERENDGFLVNWDIIARIIKDEITSITKQEGEE